MPLETTSNTQDTQDNQQEHLPTFLALERQKQRQELDCPYKTAAPALLGNHTQPPGISYVTRSQFYCIRANFCAKTTQKAAQKANLRLI